MPYFSPHEYTAVLDKATHSHEPDDAMCRAFDSAKLMPGRQRRVLKHACGALPQKIPLNINNGCATLAGGMPALHERNAADRYTRSHLKQKTYCFSQNCLLGGRVQESDCTTRSHRRADAVSPVLRRNLMRLPGGQSACLVWLTHKSLVAAHWRHCRILWHRFVITCPLIQQAELSAQWCQNSSGKTKLWCGHNELILTKMHRHPYDKVVGC